jgi:hypothetical protein
MTEAAYTMRFDYKSYLDDIARDSLREARWKLGVAARQSAASTHPAAAAYWEQVRAASVARIRELMQVTVIDEGEVRV